MAKLHRRIPRLPYLDLTLALGLLIAGPASAQDDATGDDARVAEADDPTLVRLEALSAQLASDEEAERREAYRALTTLDASYIPAIRARLADLARPRPPANWITDLMHRFHRRSATGEGDERDLAFGALTELGRPHPRRHEHEYALQLAEPLFLWRSLEAIGTDEAHRAVYPIIGLDGGRWMPEARNWVRRAGPRVMAAGLAGRSHGDRYVRRWARWTIDELGADDPGRALPSLGDDQLLEDVMLAYAGLRMQSAMRVIVSYVGSEHRGVRRAARLSMERYGGNAIWILRTGYRNETGEHPPPEWGWRRLSRELYGHIDAARLEPLRSALAEGTAARAAGDLATMQARFDEVLARAPELEEPGPVAEGYAELAAAEAAEGHRSDATAHWLRALRLAPEHAEAVDWRAAVAFAEAQEMETQGLLDREAFEQVLLVDPEHEGALAALAGPTVDAPAPRARTRWGFAAAAVLGLLGMALLWRGRSEPSEPSLAHDSTLDAPTFDEADATWADTTLPG